MPRGLHILLATPLAATGGTELSTLSISRWMMDAGHEVTLISNDHPLLEEFRRLGIHTHTAGLDRSGITGAFAGVRAIRRCLAARTVDLIDAQMARTAVQAAVASHTVAGPRVPVIWHCRGVRPRTYSLLARLGNRFIDFVITNCEAERTRLLQRGLRPDRVRTVYNFPNVHFAARPMAKDPSLLREWGIGPHTTLVGSISRLVPHRGNQHFLEAISELVLQDGLPPVHFVIVGDGPQARALSAMAVDLGVSHLVTFAGARRDMERVYATLDIVVNPTLWGMGTGNVNAEAMAWGKPVIATHVGGIPELVDHGRTGLLVSPGDSRQLAAAMRQLVQQPAVARQMGAAGRAKVNELLSPKLLVAQIEEVYRLVLSANGRQRRPL